MLTQAGATGARAAVGPHVAKASKSGAAKLPGSTNPRTERALILLALAGRAGYCGYSVAVVAVNVASYQHPALAATALWVALCASVGLGRWIWRRQAVPGVAAMLDAAVAVVALLLVAAAIRHPDQVGSQNWALGYAVGSAVWLALGPGWKWRMWLAVLLGAVYGISTLQGGASANPGLPVTALVNAVSLPLYFGIAAAFVRVTRHIAGEMAAEQALAQRQQRALAALGERERLVTKVHQSVLATLELIASGQAPWDELRGRARVQVSALRSAFDGEPDTLPADDGLHARLAAVAEDWQIDLVDDELDSEPRPEVTEALCDALAELVTGPPPVGGRGVIRARICISPSDTELVVRIPRSKEVMREPITRADIRLAEVAGMAELEPALPGEVRVRLRVPT